MVGPHVASWRRAEANGLKISDREDRFLLSDPTFAESRIDNSEIKAEFGFDGTLKPLLPADEISPSLAPPPVADIPEAELTQSLCSSGFFGRRR